MLYFHLYFYIKKYKMYLNVIFQTVYTLFTLLNLIFIVLIMYLGEPLQCIHCNNPEVINFKS